MRNVTSKDAAFIVTIQWGDVNNLSNVGHRGACGRVVAKRSRGDTKPRMIILSHKAIRILGIASVCIILRNNSNDCISQASSLCEFSGQLVCLN
jgi:hypothetical protein